jgi:3-oxoacyl-[acyl-carrier protein] reductase
MYLELEGRRALVCGASQGLGFAIAEALAAEGCHVGLLARNAEKLETHVEAFGKRGLKAQALAADMNDWPSLSIALRRFGAPPDILVNNTGGPPPSTVAKTEPEQWRKQFEAMVLNQMRLTDAVLPAMRGNKFGRILSIASTSIVEPIPGLVISGALRSALANWMKALATECARDGVTVNVLLPGSFATERINRLNAAEAKSRGVSMAKVVEESSAAIPVGRYGEPKEFASIAAFLASPRASYLTGQMIRIDGGATRAL